MKQNRRFGRAFLNIMIILTMFGVRSCIVRPSSSQQGSHFNQGKNAAWIGVEWVNDPHTPAEIAALGNDLAQKQIIYAYPYVSYWHANGEFGTNHTHAADFVSAFKHTHPEIKLIGWIGINTQYADLSDLAVRHKIATFCAEIVQKYGFDGVQIDAEIITDRNTNLISLLDKTRTAIGTGKILSVATASIWPMFPDLVSQRSGLLMWSREYYRDLAQHTDQIALMTYDSTLDSQWLYQQWSRFQVIQISQAVADTGAELLIGVPTSEELTATHKPHAETMSSGLLGIIDGLNDAEARPAAVTGVAIYPYWETDAAEWSIYDKLWLGK
jgi:hypothetical protein